MSFIPKVLIIILTIFCCADLTAFKTKTITEGKIQYFSLENDKLILYFNRCGGRLDRVFYKKGKVELIDRTYRGAFTENDWKRPGSRNFLYKRMFNMNVQHNDDTFTVEFKGHHMGGAIDFLEVNKRFTIKQNSSVITIEYDFHNQAQAMSKILYSFHVHNALTLVGEG